MSIERKLIIAVLKLTANGPVSHKLVNTQANVPHAIAQKVLRKMQSDGLINVSSDTVEADQHQRVRMALKTISLGSDIEQASSFLQWNEFENMAEAALRQSGYTTNRNLRFKHAGKRWEIDVVGIRKPFVICIDCKHWHQEMFPAKLKRIAEEQIQRTEALAESLPSLAFKIKRDKWNNARFFPTIVCLTTNKFKFLHNVPIVPILQLQDFLNQLPAYANSFAGKTVSFHYGPVTTEESEPRNSF